MSGKMTSSLILELYFDSKDLNRFSRVKELTEKIAKRINVQKVSRFERFLKGFSEKGIMVREKEGPTEGMAWKGFGGVHSHYDLTPLGVALLIFQTTLRCPAVNFRKLKFSEDWDEFFKQEMFLISLGILQIKLKKNNNKDSSADGGTTMNVGDSPSVGPSDIDCSVGGGGDGC